MHEVTERMETLLTLLLLLMLGLSPTNGLMEALTPAGMAVGLLLVFVVRPLAGWLSLSLSLSLRSANEHSAGLRLTRADMAVMSFFGVRGIGTIYYLAYATRHQTFADQEALWATAAFTIILSVLVHGALSDLVMDWLERRQA